MIYIINCTSTDSSYSIVDSVDVPLNNIQTYKHTTIVDSMKYHFFSEGVYVAIPWWMELNGIPPSHDLSFGGLRSRVLFSTCLHIKITR